MEFYDDDFDFLQLADRLDMPYNAAFMNKLARLVRVLVNYGVLYSRMSSTSKEYIDEPGKQMNYWLRSGKASLMARKVALHVAPEEEAALLLRHANPEPELSNHGIDSQF